MPLRRLKKILEKPSPAVAESPFVTRYPPGHFYSPLPDMADVTKNAKRYFDTSRATIPGIELRGGEQRSLAEAISSQYLPEMPAYTDTVQPGLRFHHGNNFYSCKDAAILYCMLRHLRPRRIIEAGSGFSSALMLDTNEKFMDRGMELLFIEPYPERLQKLLLPEDRPRTEIMRKPLQEVPLDTFQRLEAGDILFIDSTHVSKIGSDVNYIIFELLPSLKAGVHIHVHDIFYPFEYLEHWLTEGRAWNEAYLLRAFLSFNNAFRITLWNAYLKIHHPEVFTAPSWQRIPEGGSWGSIWLEKTA